MPNKPANPNDPFKGIKTGGWTKYGGARNSLEKSQLDVTWYCQSCADEQPMEMPGFMIEQPPGEYVKVCAKCFKISRTIRYSYTKTVRITRKRTT